MAIYRTKMNRTTHKPQEGFPPNLDWDPYDWMRDDTEQDPAAMRQMSPIDIARKYYAETDENGHLPPDATYKPEFKLEPKAFDQEEPMESAKRYEMLAKGKGPVLEEEEEEEYTPLDTMNDIAAINRGDYAKGNSKVWANRELANRGY